MTNAAAIGYAIIAAKRLGLTPEQIWMLDRAMHKAMDEITEEKAEEVYKTHEQNMESQEARMVLDT